MDRIQYRHHGKFVSAAKAASLSNLKNVSISTTVYREGRKAYASDRFVSPASAKGQATRALNAEAARREAGRKEVEKQFKEALRRDRLERERQRRPPPAPPPPPQRRRVEWEEEEEEEEEGGIDWYGGGIDWYEPPEPAFTYDDVPAFDPGEFDLEEDFDIVDLDDSDKYGGGTA